MSKLSSVKSAVLSLLRSVLGLDGTRHTRKVFDQIYAQGRWGKKGEDGFCSGGGSHAPAVVKPYVAAVSVFLSGLGGKQDVVDLGCGDFNVGRQIRPSCGRYIACDIVQPLIERNLKRFADLNVEFRLMDLVADAWPPGDVVVIRQVLQHLSNRQVLKVVPKIANFRYAIITEHLPAQPGFKPNNDKVTGEFIRIRQQPASGVVLHEAPFALQVMAQQTLCTVPADGGAVVTTLYRLR